MQGINIYIFLGVGLLDRIFFFFFGVAFESYRDRGMGGFLSINLVQVEVLRIREKKKFDQTEETKKTD